MSESIHVDKMRVSVCDLEITVFFQAHIVINNQDHNNEYSDKTSHANACAASIKII